MHYYVLSSNGIPYIYQAISSCYTLKIFLVVCVRKFICVCVCVRVTVCVHMSKDV